MSTPNQKENGHSQTVQHAEEMASRPSLKLTADQISLSAIKKPTDLSVAAVKEVLTGFPMKKPGPEQFFRTMSDYAVTANTICKKSLDEMDVQWLIIPDEMISYAPGHLIQEVTFIPYVTREDNFGAWPLKHPRQGQNKNEWFTSAETVIKEADERWVCVFARAGRYHYNIGEGISQEPKWPENFSEEQFYNIGLKKFVVLDSDDPTLAALNGKQ